MIVVGLDPGKATGVAFWDSEYQNFSMLTSAPVHKAMELVRIGAFHRDFKILVIFEDARQRTYFGKIDAKQAKYGAAVREGAGAAKRDAKIWAQFLADEKIPHLAQKPAAGFTKWPAEQFRKYTGWPGRTNEHSRDAGLLVYGMKTAQAVALLKQATK